MAVNFKYIMVEINGKPVLVDKRSLSDASKSLQDGLNRIYGATEGALKKVMASGFAVQTPDGMSPVHLGSADDFSRWVSANLTGGSFDLKSSVDALPDPFKTALDKLVTADLVVYSAALFFTGDTDDTTSKNKLYGEMVLGVQFPTTSAGSFPLALREVVIEVDNYPAA